MQSLKQIIVGGLILLGTLQAQSFYTGLSYGSEALFNPVTVMLNNGYDILQLGNRPRNILNLPYMHASGNVWKSITHPGRTISEYGTKTFITSELFPLKFSIKYVQWWPNYNVHLIGGGMTYRMLIEWYEHHHFPTPKLFSIATVSAYHYLNEVVENDRYTGYNGDAVADLLFFDIAGVILFSNDRVAKFFKETLNMSDWSLQPSFRLGDKTLHNNGQYFTLKWDLPFSETWQLFYTFGMDGLVGLSYQMDQEHTVSFGAGAIGRELVDVDVEKNIKTVELIGTLGVFYDRNNSLLASLKIGNHIDYQAVLNIYPGIIKLRGFAPGVWTAVNKHGEFLFGVTTLWTPGLVF